MRIIRSAYSAPSSGESVSKFSAWRGSRKVRVADRVTSASMSQLTCPSTRTGVSCDRTSPFRVSTSTSMRRVWEWRSAGSKASRSAADRPIVSVGSGSSLSEGRRERESPDPPGVERLALDLLALARARGRRDHDVPDQRLEGHVAGVELHRLVRPLLQGVEVLLLLGERLAEAVHEQARERALEPAHTGHDADHARAAYR